MAWRQLFLLDDAGDADAARAARLRRAVRDTAQMLWDDEALPASVRGRAAFARAQASALLGQRDEALTWVRRAIDIDPSQPGYRRFLEDLTGGGAP
jgi:tetratricopeptide (TPR) repeat protein